MKKGIGVLTVLLAGAALVGCSAQSAQQQVQAQLDNAKHLTQAAFQTPQASSGQIDPETIQRVKDAAAQFVLAYFNFAAWVGSSNAPAIDLNHVSQRFKPEYLSIVQKDAQSFRQEFGNTLPVLESVKVQNVAHTWAKLDGKDALVFRVTFDLNYKPNPRPIPHHTATVYLIHSDDYGWVVDSFTGKVGQ